MQPSKPLQWLLPLLLTAALPRQADSVRRLRSRLPPRAFRDLEPHDDEFLKHSLWRGQGMHGEFRFMDNLEPVAPMDRLGSASSVSRLATTGQSASGTPSEALYVPPYLFPDAFPTGPGKPCECEVPKPVEPSPEQLKWAEIVAKQLGVSVSSLPMPMSPQGRTNCSCPDDVAHHWVKMQPVPNSTNFTLTPVDVSYEAGDYWQPHVVGGLASPMDKLPPAQYPMQAPGDWLWQLPSSAVEDRISKRFATYIDQVEARARKRPNATCAAGDAVELRAGNSLLNATVLEVKPVGALLVEFAPAAAGAVACAEVAGCSAFRFCYGADGSCVAQVSEAWHDWAGRLQRRLLCPAGTAACATVQELVSAGDLQKGGRECIVDVGDDDAE